MNTSVLQRRGVKELTLLVAGILVAASLMFTAAAPRAHAASLTEPQIQSILNLLTAFNVPAATIANVSAILHKSK